MNEKCLENSRLIRPVGDMSGFHEENQSARVAIARMTSAVYGELTEKHEEVRALNLKVVALEYAKDDAKKQALRWQGIAEIETASKLREMDKSRDSTLIMIISMIVTFVSLGVLVFNWF
ncbi:MAG: hypothetical protein K2Q13_10325 [Nitrosomonas sp.]|uniref:hypothetical protein n=1 Tax=Nitrosomonas sp. TaxID=42353 RepID=UPI0025DA199D|nr:hypothetical protein [Nitrosomonas sp.]MBY0475437.1 hypothetical protein [Nitrosomonas sp.]